MLQRAGESRKSGIGAFSGDGGPHFGPIRTFHGPNSP
jgi:hypothetical protein